MYDNENNNMGNGSVENNNVESNNIENGMMEMENKNVQNSNIESNNVEESNMENKNIENSNMEINNKMEENGNYRMTQGDIINNGITNIEQNDGVNMNVDNNNNVNNDNGMNNNTNMDNPINTVNGMDTNNNINNTYNSYSNNGMGYNNAAGSSYNNGYGNNANYNGNVGYGNNNMGYGNNNSYANNYSANNHAANNNNYSGYNPYNNPNNNINNKNPMNGKTNNMNNSFNSKKVKNKSGIGKKIAAVALSAVMFGAIAGGTMYGVYYTANEIKPVNNSSNIQLPLVSSGAALEDSDNFDNIKISSSEELNVKKVASAAMPAMVALSGTTQVSSGFGFGQNYQAQTSGTGIIVGKNDSELLVLTNAHVVEDVNNLTCTFIDNESVECTVKGSKSNKDVAVVTVPLSSIKSSTMNQIAIAELGDSDSVVLGQEVVAIGNALGKGQSVTSGIISALNRSITVDNVTFDNLIMTDAAINSGNSGGALLDASGKVVGINFAKTSADGVQGMAYAIPISNVRDLIDSLMNRETRTKVSESEMGYLGVNLLDVTSSVAELYGYPQGTMIRAVEENSAADKAGLGVYDIIVSFDDQTITTSSSLLSTLQYYKAGETVKIEYYHIEGNEYVLKSADITLDKKSN